MKEEAKALKKDMADLEVLHRDSASLKHAIREYDDQWHQFTPSRFIYTFFTFNTLYTIDWKVSLVKGKIVCYDDEDYPRKSEDEKFSDANRYHRYIDFCFRDKAFVKIYSEFFFDFIGQTYSKEEITKSLEKITIDVSTSGAIKTQDFIDRFRDAWNEILTSKTLKEEFCRRIVTFIYKIRCNIFHGAKTLKELHNPLQKKRIDIYAVFMIAINQMVFSYIDYLNGIDITYEFDSLRKDLNDKNYD